MNPMPSNLALSKEGRPIPSTSEINIPILVNNPHYPSKKRPAATLNEKAEEPASKLHPDEPRNFFNLSMALKTWLSHTITEGQIKEGEKYMLEYLKGVWEVH